MRRISIALCLAANLASPAFGCSIFYPEDYVPPTTEELISRSDLAFVGTVIGLRSNTSEVVVPPDCDDTSGPKWYRCAHLDDESAVSVILSVDHAIRGIGDQQFFETHQGDGAECTVALLVGRRYLFLNPFDSMKLEHDPAPEQLAVWRSLPQR